MSQPTADQPVQQAVQRLYRDGGDLPFEVVLREQPCADDDALADLIDADGRARLRAGLEVTLERYLQAVPGLTGRPVALDAAIDFALRALVPSSGGEPEAATRLKSRHPKLAGEIDAAAEFGRALTSTVGVGGGDRHRTLPLPCDAGPLSLMGKARYRLVRLLGAGSQGTSYLAEDRQLSTPEQSAHVCVKMLTTERARTDQSPLLGEAMKARRINHPAVVRVLDRGVFHGQEYIVYEFVEGQGLDSWVAKRGRPLRPDEAARLVTRIARGVQAAHSAGLVHRDLKPDNILITPEGEPKITDFGAAAVVELDGSSADGPGVDAPVGNLAFMAPEQFWMRSGAIAPTADLYALGGLLFYLATGQLPNGTTAEQVRRRHEGLDIGPPPRTRQGWLLDTDLRAICAKSMAASAEDRHTSADALAADLETWLAHRPIPWTNPTLARRAWLLVRREPLLPVLLVALTVILILSLRVAQLTLWSP